jgi:hypothetical protein
MESSFQAQLGHGVNTMSDKEHILLLGASGVSGIIFINHYLTLPASSRPYLTIYGRSAKKLPSTLKDHEAPARVRIITGELADASKFATALIVSAPFPPITTAISLLGAYMSLMPVVARFFATQQTPIADAFESTIMPLLRQNHVNRILSLSTPLAWNSNRERRTMGWTPWLISFMPYLFAPQGNEEMKGIAKNSIEGAREGLDWTVFRVPLLTEGPDKGVFAGELDRNFPWTGTLNREGQAKWLLREIQEARWLGKAPMLVDAA